MSTSNQYKYWIQSDRAGFGTYTDTLYDAKLVRNDLVKHGFTDVRMYLEVSSPEWPFFTTKMIEVEKE